MTFYAPASSSSLSTNADANEALELNQNHGKSLPLVSFTNAAFSSSKESNLASSSFDGKVSADLIVDSLLHAHEDKFV